MSFSITGAGKSAIKYPQSNFYNIENQLRNY